MIVIVCPGQGSQTPGFLAPWLELSGAREHLTALSDAAEVDLVTHGTTSDEDTIKDTAVAQPLLVAAGLVAAARLRTPRGTRRRARRALGRRDHRLGAWPASSPRPTAMRFVRERANGMAAGQRRDTHRA